MARSAKGVDFHKIQTKMKGVVIHANGTMSETTEEKFFERGFDVEMMRLGDWTLMFDEDGLEKKLPYNALASCLTACVHNFVGDVFVGNETEEHTVESLKARFAHVLDGDDEESDCSD